MTKREYQSAVASRPMGADGLAKIRAIVKDHQFGKVNETACDAFTAGAIIAVYDALKPENQAKLLTFPVWRVQSVCLKLLANQERAK